LKNKGTYQKGLSSEEQVSALYQQRHKAVLKHHRYKTPYGEIDLILETDDKIYFVEVKMRRTTTQAALSLRPAQQMRLAQAILHFSADYPALQTKVFQFDVALVDANTHIEVIENVILNSDGHTL
jgi:putative endonuclease